MPVPPSNATRPLRHASKPSSSVCGGTASLHASDESRSRVGSRVRESGAAISRPNWKSSRTESKTATSAELRLARRASNGAPVALEALEDEERAIAEQVQLPAEGLVANLRGDLRALENASERDLRELEAIASRRRVVVDRLDEETSETVELNRSIQQADAAVTASQRGYDEARTHREGGGREMGAGRSGAFRRASRNRRRRGANRGPRSSDRRHRRSGGSRR